MAAKVKRRAADQRNALGHRHFCADIGSNKAKTLRIACLLTGFFLAPRDIGGEILSDKADARCETIGIAQGVTIEIEPVPLRRDAQRAAS